MHATRRAPSSSAHCREARLSPCPTWRHRHPPPRRAALAGRRTARCAAAPARPCTSCVPLLSAPLPVQPTCTEQYALGGMRQRVLGQVGGHAEDRRTVVSYPIDPAHRLTTSNGPRSASSLPPGPEEKMIPFPPVTRTSSRALLRKFWRYRFAASGGVERGGKRPAAYKISNLCQIGESSELTTTPLRCACRICLRFRRK